MRNLIELLNKYNHQILFILLEFFAFFLIIQNNSFQKAAFINSTNGITASSFLAISNVKSYFSLKSTNELLLLENAKLKSLISYQSKDSISSTNPNHYIPATIINNSVARANNYITIDKGSIDGIKKGMGVVSNNGVIGIVKETSKHFSSVLSVLHSQSKVSVVLKKNNHFGSLQWDGRSYKKAKIYDIPSHVNLEIGDTITTSGFSYIFPSNTIVGVISEIKTKDDDKFHNLRMSFMEDLKEVKYVNVCQPLKKQEKELLESEIE
ncbi:rod shape-determining protein MreC [Flavobacteriales bacterium]|jgi:rod shape-determining protein MreC|nr:rod shape-determining protein MreC [Flavobacteriales bacterium]